MQRYTDLKGVHYEQAAGDFICSGCFSVSVLYSTVIFCHNAYEHCAILINSLKNLHFLLSRAYKRYAGSDVSFESDPGVNVPSGLGAGVDDPFESNPGSDVPSGSAGGSGVPFESDPGDVPSQ